MEQSFSHKALRVSWVNFILNIALSVFKLLAGLLAHSAAMVSDGIQSAADVGSTVIVMVGVKMSGKESDREHPYGHERMECVAAIILATIVCITGLGLGAGAIEKLISGSYRQVQSPGVLAVAAALISVVTKEWMFHYTRRAGRRLDSSALAAMAWDHRSDALATTGVLVGILASRLGFPAGDVLGSLVVSLMIIRAAVGIFREAVDKMVDKSCGREFEEALEGCVLAHPQVRGIALLQTRVFGSKVYVDLELLVDGSLSLHQAHRIAEEVHDAIETAFPKVKHIMIHTEPDGPE